jgi:hypothetical protein
MSWLQDFELHPGMAEIISSMVDFKIRLFTELVGLHWLSVVVDILDRFRADERWFEDSGK